MVHKASQLNVPYQHMQPGWMAEAKYHISAKTNNICETEQKPSGVIISVHFTPPSRAPVALIEADDISSEMRAPGKGALHFNMQMH